MVARKSFAIMYARQSAIARVLASLIIILAFFSVPMAAIDPHRLITQYGHTAWRTQDGFLDRPSALTQTTDGYIWIGTESGLMRFDGVTFKPWSPPAGESLPHVGDLLGTPDGSLWMATASGLFRLKDGVLASYDKKRHSPGISALIEGHDGTIWLTRYRVNDGKGPLCRVSGTELQCFGKNEGIPGRYGLGLAEDSMGNIWFGCQALCRWAPGSSEVYFKEQLNNTVGNGVSRVAMGPSGTLWATLEGVGPGLGVQYYKDAKWSTYAIPGFDGSTAVSQTLFVDRNHTLWVGTQSAGLYHIHDGFADHYGSAQGLSGNFVIGIYEDRENNIWITTDRGIDLFRDLTAATFAGNEGLIGPSVSAVYAQTDGSVWVGNQGALNIIRPSGISAITTGHGLPGNAVKAIFKDRVGRMWLGIDKKLMTYKDGRFLEVRRSDGSPSGIAGGADSFAEDGEGNLWVLDGENSSQASLFRVRDEHIVEKIPIEKVFPQPAAITKDRDGGIWVLYQRGTLARFRDGKAETAAAFVNHDQPINTYGFFADSDNVLWLGTSKGLYRYKDGVVTVMDSRNGLPCSSIFAMMEDNDGARWLYTRCGLVKISGLEFANWLKSPNSKVPVRVYDALDGVQPGQSQLYEPNVSKSPDGRIWFASDTFVQMIDPGSNHTNAVPPPVHIEELVADHKNYAIFSNLKLPPLSNDLEISYTALSFTIPRKVLFRYKLEGHDQQWQEAGTRRQAFYNDLRPGHYRFRVIACNNDGIWNEAGTSLDFSILPAYYQTTWFRTICMAVFALLVWAIYQLRVQRLQRQFAIGLEARVTERTRIARELHDTLLQTLHGLMFQFQAVRNLLPRRPEEAMKSLDDTIAETEKALAESRDAIQGLRSEAMAKADLGEMLTTTSQELANSGNVNGEPPAFELIVEGERRPLALAIKEELFRITREILRNAYRHARATRIETEIRYDHHELRVRIRDNGSGIDSRVLAEGGVTGHWGLRGMRERAERIGARLDFWSEAGAGTEVQLVVPSALAYEVSRRSSKSLFKESGRA